MRFSTTLATAATALFFTASQVSAIGELAFNLGVKNNDGTCKSTSDYETELQALKSYTSTVKVYAASDCNTLQNLGPAAEAEGFTIFVGVWPTDDSHYAAEKAALQTYLPKIKESTVAGFLVGSEALYRNDLTASQLSDKINDVRSVVADISDSDGKSYSGKQVGTVDSWNVWLLVTILPLSKLPILLWLTRSPTGKVKPCKMPLTHSLMILCKLYRLSNLLRVLPILPSGLVRPVGQLMVPTLKVLTHPLTTPNNSGKKVSVP